MPIINRQPVAVRSPFLTSDSYYDTFDGSGSLNSSKWNTYDPDSDTTITVTQTSNQYQGSVVSAGATGSTWFDSDEGIMHYVTMTGDFEFIARNVGLLSGSDPTGKIQFCGIIVWLSAGNYEFAVVGNRAEIATNTHENKATVSFSSNQNDEGTDSAWSDRSDLRVTRVGSTVNFYRQEPGTNPDSWTLNNHAGITPRVSFGTGAVRVGMITYGYSFPTDFTGAIDQVEIPIGTPVV